MPLEPVPNRARADVDSAFPRVIEEVQRLAGDGLRALILSGSHATGEAVWVREDGRLRSLSDLDLYLVLDSPEARAGVLGRASAVRPVIDAAAREEGVDRPVEISFLTEEGLAALPARPGTLELRRHGRVVAGDPAVRSRIPDWSPAEVSAEERLLLLENRAFEVLLAHPALAEPGASRLEARHALHKTALDLAAAAALEHGEFPDGASARVEWARQHRPSPPPAWSGGEAPFGPALERVWDEAVAWRERGASGASPDDGAWPTVAAAWCALWLHLGRWGAASANPYDLARRAARRAPLRRRVRHALRPEGGTARARGRVLHGLTGTPQHRVNAAAAVLLLAATRSGGDPGRPVLGEDAASTLRTLGFPAATAWDPAARAVTRAWDVWVQDGRRVPAW